jgi:cytochrome c peroxidase
MGAQIARSSQYRPVAAAVGLVLLANVYGFGLVARGEAPEASTALSQPAEVGRLMFFDRSLSKSGAIACATCHDPRHAYAPANGLAVQPGGPTLADAGTRAVPSLRYLEFTPAYSDLFDNPDGVSAPGPGGGFTLDGRAATLAEQAKIPLLSAIEMANASPDAVVARIAAGPYTAEFRRAFGADIFDRGELAFQRATEALQAFETEDVSFHPYTSKYDLYASNKMGGTLTTAEQRGFAVFLNPAKGNCVACHFNGAGIGGAIRLFTDHTYAAIGVPRNPDIPANRNPAYFDLGICSRTDHPLPQNARYCGLFKTPTLRNVATRRVFFHNGQLKSLRDAIRFYNTRDTNPDRWYPTVNGVVQKFDDLPPSYRRNVDRQVPLDGRAPGSAPAMTEQEMDDLEAFLNTLNDADVQSRDALSQSVPLVLFPTVAPGR